MTDTATTQRVTPFNRIGQLEAPHVEVESVLEEAGLDFTVSKRAIQYQRLDGTWVTSDDRAYIVADDDEQPFDVVSKDYGVFQYAEAFAFLDTIDGREFVAAGPLSGRKQAFMAVKLPDLDDFNVAGDDMHELNVIVRTSHNRTRALEVFLLPTRMRCTNQLPVRSFDKSFPNRWSVNHIGNMQEKIHDGETLVKRARGYVEEYKRTAGRLANIKIDHTDGQSILDKVLRDTTKKDEVIDTILTAWATRETVGYTGTGWGLVNAVSEYFEWDRSGGTAQSRFLAALEGQTRKVVDNTTTFLLGRYGQN